MDSLYKALIYIICFCTLPFLMLGDYEAASKIFWLLFVGGGFYTWVWHWAITPIEPSTNQTSGSNPNLPTFRNAPPPPQKTDIDSPEQGF